MSLHESQYADANHRPTNSALSGKPLDFGGGDIAIQINGYHLGVKVLEWRTATPEQQAAALAEWADALPRNAPQTLLSADNYDTMTFAELKTMAKDRGVDISGRKSQADVLQALRYADLQAKSGTATSAASIPPDSSEMIGE